MKKIYFTKMHGLGNDFIIIENLGSSRSCKISITAKLAQHLCDRRFGIGADQVLWLNTPSHLNSDIRMDIINADGSIAEMCGNGIRAATIYIHRYTHNQKTSYQIETLAGIKTTQLIEQEVQVNMGIPAFYHAKKGETHLLKPEKLTINNQLFDFYRVDIGNPHAVIFVENLEHIPLQKWGSFIENHPLFPNRTNVEFVEITDQDSIKVRIWERGAGMTLACGTGACAAVAVSIETKRIQNSIVTVYLPGGKLKIFWDGKQSPILMTGPATEVFSGILTQENT